MPPECKLAGGITSTFTLSQSLGPDVSRASSDSGGSVPKRPSGEIRFPGCSGQESLEPRQQLQENVPPLEREEVRSGDAGPCVQRGSHLAPHLKPPQGWKCPVRRCFSSSSFPPLTLLSLSGAGLLARGLAHGCGPVGWGEFTSASVQAACFPTAGSPCGLSDGVPHPPGPPHSLPVGNKTHSFRLSVKPGGALSLEVLCLWRCSISGGALSLEVLYLCRILRFLSFCVFS